MASEMIERVARSLVVAEFGMFPNMTEYVDSMWLQFSDELAGRYRDRARAAIAAMRACTDAMVNAGMDCGSVSVCYGEVETRYQAMIDEALKE